MHIYECTYMYVCISIYIIVFYALEFILPLPSDQHYQFNCLLEKLASNTSFERQCLLALQANVLCGLSAEPRTSCFKILLKLNIRQSVRLSLLN